jgi:hypothetical protein
MRYSFLYIILLFLIGGACIDPIDLAVSSKANKVVVDGTITTEEGVYTIKLSRSLPFNNNNVPPVYLVPETGATVRVEDGNGNSYDFPEVQPGVYQSLGDFTGIPGESYVLKFTIAEGKTYQSKPEVMPDIIPVHDIEYAYESYERVVENSEGQPVVVTEYGFTLTVVVDDPDDERNYYRWKSNGTFEFFSNTDNPDIQKCWANIAQLESGVVATDDRFTDGNEFKTDIGIIPYDRETKFMARVTQMILTASSYAFWEQVKKQQSNTGSIFDPTPSMIRGNIFNVDNEDESVLGYFQTAAVTKDSVLIDRFRASGSVSPSPRIDPQDGDCRNHWPGATNVRPPGF